MNKNKAKKNKQIRRHKKVRAKIKGTKKRPRLSVFRSNKGMYLQLIDDEKSKTLISASSREIKKGNTPTLQPIDKTRGKQGSKQASSTGSGRVSSVQSKKVAIGFELGKLIAKRALDKEIKTIVFDRGGYKYHGRVKAVADGAREGGLKF